MCVCVWVYIYISSCFQLLTLSSTSGRWTHVSGEKCWNNADMVGKKWSGFKKTQNNTTFPTTSLTATDLELSNFQTSITDLDLEITFLFLILLIPTHLAVITNTTTISIFWSANTNLRMWSCTAATVRCCHSTECNTATICHLTYHRFLTTISSNKAKTTSAEIIM